MGLRLRSNEARRPLAPQPSGRRVLWLWAVLAPSSQPALGMRLLRRFAHTRNPLP
jgi:hypothetical protein